MDRCNHQMITHQVHGYEIPSHHMKGVSTKKSWRCETCDVKVTTYVTLSEPPTHSCKKQTGKIIPLKETK